MTAALAMTILMGATPDSAFREQYGAWFEIESVVERKLAEPWPAGNYRVLYLKPKRAGAVGVKYSFVRRRDEGPETVEREFSVHVIGDTEERATVIDHPHHLPVRMRDRIWIPIPLSDPWGEPSDLRWHAPNEAPTHGPFEPRDDGCPHPKPAVPAPLELISVRCTSIALRIPERKHQAWGLFRARATGKVDERLEVVSGARVIRAPSLDERISRPGSATSSTLGGGKSVGYPISIGDLIWLRL